MINWLPTIFLLSILIFAIGLCVLAVAFKREVERKLEEKRIEERRLNLRMGPGGQILHGRTK